jgi:hypothetical protein
MWTGQNFKLKCKKVAGYPNYGESAFMNPTPVAKSDEEIEAIWKSEYSLKEFKDPSKFKSYDELKTRLDEVLNGTSGNEMKAPAKSIEQIEAEMESAIPSRKTAAAPTPSSSDDGDVDLEALLKDL